MPKPRVRIEVVENNTDKIIARIQSNRKRLIEQYTASIQRQAAARAPKRTGSGAASIYKSASGKSDYGERVGEAHRLNKYFKALAQVYPSGKEGVVGVAAFHGQFMERRTGFFEKTIESQRGKYLVDVARIHVEDL
ncbi:MAG: hypothetical protein U0641_05685 [Anaerolineae bacterium]